MKMKCNVRTVKRELYERVIVQKVTYRAETWGVSMDETQARCYGSEVFSEYALSDQDG